MGLCETVGIDWPFRAKIVARDRSSRSKAFSKDVTSRFRIPCVRGRRAGTAKYSFFIFSSHHHRTSLISFQSLLLRIWFVACEVETSMKSRRDRGTCIRGTFNRQNKADIYMKTIGDGAVNIKFHEWLTYVNVINRYLLRLHRVHAAFYIKTFLQITLTSLIYAQKCKLLENYKGELVKILCKVVY